MSFPSAGRPGASQPKQTTSTLFAPSQRKASDDRFSLTPQQYLGEKPQPTTCMYVDMKMSARGEKYMKNMGNNAKKKTISMPSNLQTKKIPAGWVMSSSSSSSSSAAAAAVLTYESQFFF
jgi:hypothetical protein